MKIYLSPVRMDDKLIASVDGDTITVNGTVLDFLPLQEGETLPNAAIPNDWIVGEVHRVAGEIVLTLRLPHGATAPQETRFPDAYDAPMTVLGGEVPLPPYDSPHEEVLLP